MDEWRIFLYPFGFLSSIAFGTRFIIQWLQSERAGMSLSTSAFWRISLLGNALLIVHSFVQIQYHICLIQVGNAVIAWRNLDLIQRRAPPLSTRLTVTLWLSALLLTTLAFACQSWLLADGGGWFRIPRAPWQHSTTSPLPLFWHLLGAIAYLIFSSRFFVQWWLAERSYTSLFTPSFWWLSLIGGLTSIAYFARIGDSVNLIGPLLGLAPYARNLILLQHKPCVVRKL